jgi:hypothetical protein
VLHSIVSVIPDEWLNEEPSVESASGKREVYFSFLKARAIHSEIFVNEAKHAREALV